MNFSHTKAKPAADENRKVFFPKITFFNLIFSSKPCPASKKNRTQAADENIINIIYKKNI
jgi:hypothetical protein